LTFAQLGTQGIWAHLLLAFDQEGGREGGGEGGIAGVLPWLLHGRDGRETGSRRGKKAPKDLSNVGLGLVIFFSEEDEIVVKLFLRLEGKKGGRTGEREGCE